MKVRVKNLTLVIFCLILFLTAYFAGILGALTGLGGGVIIVPALAVALHINLHYAMGASLIAIIATSTSTSISYLRKDYINIRIGMFLETGAVIGAIIGALLLSTIPTGTVGVIFGMILLFSIYLNFKREEKVAAQLAPHPLAKVLAFDVNVQAVPLAFIIMTIAGGLSGLLGIGSGALKVLAMDHVMRLPYKMSTTTSNFIIGITAAASAGIYFANGYIDPLITAPVMIGAIFGSLTGTKILEKCHIKILRVIFNMMILLLATEMIYKGLIGNL